MLPSYFVLVPSATVTNNGNIPVGIAVARQRYVSSSNHKTQTHVKESLSTSTSAASYSSAVPYHQAVIDASVFSSSIPNIGKDDFSLFQSIKFNVNSRILT